MGKPMLVRQAEVNMVTATIPGSTPNHDDAQPHNIATTAQYSIREAVVGTTLSPNSVWCERFIFDGPVAMAYNQL